MKFPTSFDEVFINDPTDEDDPAIDEHLAGMPYEVAQQLLEIVDNLSRVLVGSAGLTKEEAAKKIRWATHVVANRD